MRLLALLMLFAATAAPTSAHEASMGVLQLREVRPGSYVGGWTLEPTIGAARVQLSLPPHGRTLGRLLAATALACLGTAVLVRLLDPAALEAGPGFGPLAELGVACVLFLPPAAAMGALFGCLLQAVRDRRGTLGWAVSVNSLGALAAPPVAALLMVPALGAWAALLPVALGYALLGMCWCGTRRAECSASGCRCISSTCPPCRRSSAPSWTCIPGRPPGSRT